MFDSFSSYSTVVTVFTIIASVLAVAGTVLFYIFIYPEKKAEKLPKFLQIARDIFTFKDLLIETILKGLYILSTLFVVIWGFFLLFGPTVLVGLLFMIIGPIAVRFSYEIVMMGILLLKNVIEINKKLKNKAIED